MRVTTSPRSRVFFFSASFQPSCRGRRQSSVFCGFLVALSLFGILSGCASRPSGREIMEERLSQARPSRDTLWTDAFYLNQPENPERSVERWQFFYKDCEIARRRVMPSRSEWECQAPR